VLLSQCCTIVDPVSVFLFCVCKCRKFWDFSPTNSLVGIKGIYFQGEGGETKVKAGKRRYMGESKGREVRGEEGKGMGDRRGEA